MKQSLRLLTFILSIMVLSSGIIGCAAEGNTGHSAITDVATDQWYTEAVLYCLSNNIVAAASVNTFSPQEPMSRGDTAMAVWQIAGSPSASAAVSLFQDVADDAEYAEAVRWMAEESVMSGYTSSIFGAGDPITREQMAAILHRYDQHTGGISAEGGTVTFSDSGTISDWAASAVSWSAKEQIISGRTGGIFAPKDMVTRAEACLMLYRYLQRDTGDSEIDPGAGEKDRSKSGGDTTSDAEENTVTGADNNISSSDNTIAVDITVGTQVFAATFYDSEAASELTMQMPLTVTMSDLNRNEKYYYLPENLPVSGAERPQTIQAGDIMCWSGNCLVLFYDTFANSYGGYVRLGRIDDVEGLSAALGTGDVAVTFAISQ